MTLVNKRIFKNFSAYFFSSIVAALVGLLANPVLALKLSHSDYAVIGYYSSFTLLLTPIVTLSLQSYYARKYFMVDDVEREKIYGVLLTLFSTISAVIFIVFVLLYHLYHSKLVESIPYSPYALLSFLPIYFSSFYNLYLTDLKMKGEGGKYAVVTIANSVLSALLSILLVYSLEYGAEGRLFALLLTTILFFFYSVLAKRVHFQWNKMIIRESLTFCWPLVVSGVLSFFFLGIDRVFLERLDDTHSLGLYNVGMQVSSYLSIFGTVLLQTFDPDLYKYTSRLEHKKVILLCVFVVIVVLLPNILFICCSKPIISLLTAGKYVDSVSFANILCLKNVTTTFAYIMSGVIIGYGFSKYELLNRSLGAIISVLLYYILISKYGFYGAAWGQCLSWLFMGFISILCLVLMFKRNVITEHNTTGV